MAAMAARALRLAAAKAATRRPPVAFGRLTATVPPQRLWTFENGRCFSSSGSSGTASGSDGRSTGDTGANTKASDGAGDASVANSGSSSHSSVDEETAKAMKNAKEAQRMWNTMVPERNWDVRSPMFPALIFCIVILQVLIYRSGSDEELEQQEVDRLKAERLARREAQRAAASAAAERG
eukprot:TRINITY_DN24649_c0_g2_i1.p2 TRINITY_DN24649_c0_g2~~TRINITY_DN24649_c0_g2_i1.p2  ORF type:complete len:206 (+),score=62.08 TRINITY_DN24649_c0_g2_i1:80-619(+)